jgi:hypothetical protein
MLLRAFLAYSFPLFEEACQGHGSAFERVFHGAKDWKLYSILVVLLHLY